MGLPSASTLTGRHTDQPGAGGTRLYGQWLLLARLLWCATFVLSLAYFDVSMVVNRSNLLTTSLLVAATSVWFAVSGVLFWRKSTDWIILLVPLGLVVVGGVYNQPFPNA